MTVSGESWPGCGKIKSSYIAERNERVNEAGTGKQIGNSSKILPQHHRRMILRYISRRTENICPSKDTPVNVPDIQNS